MDPNTSIPLLDPGVPDVELEDELVSVFRSSLKMTAFVGGAMVEEFEKDFAKFCGAQYCVGVGSGTDALRLALLAAGIGRGHTVLTAPNIFVATTEAILQAGGHVEFVDIHERTYSIDVPKLEEYLRTRCKIDAKSGRPISRKTNTPVMAIVPVHLYGQMADMDRILQVAEQYRLVVIEDACQAHGAEYFSRRENCWKAAGTMGHAAAFSFYPGNNLAACGEAGAVTTNSEELAHTLRLLRDRGQTGKSCHDLEGYNGRLDAIQAGIMTAKLRRLPVWNNKRRVNASRYRKLFESTTDRVVLPYEPSNVKAVYHLFVVRTAIREQLRAHLSDVGIGTGIHYPIPVHLQAAYRGLGYRKHDFPVAEKVASEILSLPMYPQLQADQQEHVVRQIAEQLSKTPIGVRSPHPTPGSFACSMGIMAHNEEGNIGRLLEALLSQRLRDVALTEIIVIASGCTDRTEAIVRRWSEWDHRIRLVSQPRREGKASAVNLFLTQACEKIVLLCSADLLPEKNTIEQIIAPFVDPEIGMTTCRPVPVNDRDTFMGFTAHLMWDLHHQINLSGFKAGELIAFRKIFERIPYRTAVDEASIEPVIRGQGYKVKYVPNAIVHNKGPETIRDFLRQRRRIYAGHLAVRDAVGYTVSTMNGMSIVPLVLRQLDWHLRPLLWTWAVAALEAYGRLLGRHDYANRRDHAIWEIATTTKKLKADLSIGRATGTD
jgi:dTDP-4-amino-4,6-dideoxygalactose transaminase/glycosyltransferase involved in cell wall biosynthesis